jgi:crossover junction endodeoxyribonuclease RuvC
VSVIRIIGIDPGSRITGYGIIESERSRQRCIAYGCIRTRDGELPQRLLQIQHELAAVLQEHAPQEAAVEQVFVKLNVASAIVLGQARGVALSAVAGAGVSLAEYSPAKVKQSICGNGRAEKHQIQHMVKLLLKLPEEPQADAADALAIALCHAHMRGMQQILARAAR